MALINLDRPIPMPDGRALLLPPVEPNGPSNDATLKHICMAALLASLEGDTTTPNLAYRLYQLAARLNEGGEVEIEAGDLHIIKSRLERTQAPWIVGKCWDLLENRTAPLAELPEPVAEPKAFPPRF